MNIAELFVNLGVKGSEKTVGALTGVKKGLGEVSSMSLEAKAGILGAMYALERLMTNSAQTGTGLSNFAALTGLSMKSLQQWQYAARQAGVSSEELTGSLKGVQQGISNMLMGKGAPEGLGLIVNKTHMLTDKKHLEDTFYVMQKLQEYAKSVPPDVGNIALKSFGLSEGTISAMRKGVFNNKNFAKAPTYSDNEVGQLNKVDVAWKNLGANIQMAMGHFTSKHGLQLVGEISQITTAVLKMVDAFTKLAEKLKLFQVIGKAFEGWGMIFDKLTGVVDRVGKDKGGALHGAGKEGLNFLSGLAEAGKGAYLTAKDSLTPSPAYTGSGKTQNIQVNQNLNFQHEGKDHKKTGDSVKKAIQDSYRQMSAQTQGS